MNGDSKSSVAELDALQAEADALKRLQTETAAELDALLDRAWTHSLLARSGFALSLAKWTRSRPRIRPSGLLSHIAGQTPFSVAQTLQVFSLVPNSLESKENSERSVNLRHFGFQASRP